MIVVLGIATAAIAGAFVGFVWSGNEIARALADHTEPPKAPRDPSGKYMAHWVVRGRTVVWLDPSRDV